MTLSRVPKYILLSTCLFALLSGSAIPAKPGALAAPNNSAAQGYLKAKRERRSDMETGPSSWLVNVVMKEGVLINRLVAEDTKVSPAP